MTRGGIAMLAQTLGRALRLALCGAPRLAAALAALAFAQALLPLLTLLALKRAVDAAAGLLAAATGTDAAVRAGGLWQILRTVPEARATASWFVVGALAIGAHACLRSLASWVAEQHAMAVSDAIHARLHARLLSLDLAFFENSEEQDRLHLAQSQAMTRPISVLDGLFQLLQGGLGFLGVLLLLASLHPLVPLALLLAGIPALLVRLRRGRRFYAWRHDLAPLEREAGYFHHLLTNGAYAGELRLQGHGAFCRGRFEAVRTRLRAARLEWRRYALSGELALQFLALAVAAALLLWMTGRLLAGALTLGALVMYAQAVQRGQGQLGVLASAVAELYQSALFLQAFDGLMALPAHVTAPASPRPVPSPPRKGIRFERVSFCYPGTQRPVLRDLDFTLAPGECVALAGANGAGKSTLVKLLCRLYDPTDGRILVDGTDLRELDPAAWRSRIGVLFQEYGRYQLTAAENVWLGDPRGSAADARVAEAARRTGLDAVVQRWPQGLATPLGRWLRAGTEPSAGEWQRIALARALLRDADLLILDEPTSALDARTQQDVLRILRDAAAERATLLVSHRPEMLAWAHRVLVLRDGALVETGDAASLLAGHGEFARLFDRNT